MNITINANITILPAVADAMPLLQEILTRVQQLTEKETQMDAVLQSKIDDLVSRVNNLSTIEDSMIALLGGLSSMIADLKKGTTDPAQLAAIDNLASTVSGLADKATAALVNNTTTA